MLNYVWKFICFLYDFLIYVYTFTNYLYLILLLNNHHPLFYFMIFSYCNKVLRCKIKSAAGTMINFFNFFFFKCNSFKISGTELKEALAGRLPNYQKIWLRLSKLENHNCNQCRKYNNTLTITDRNCIIAFLSYWQWYNW
jgi:hypothetical protein